MSIEDSIGVATACDETTQLHKCFEPRQKIGDPPGLSSDAVGKYLYTYGCPHPDLSSARAGKVRLPGLMLWQSAYSECHFCDA